MDLKVQRLQNETLRLQTAQKTMEYQLSRRKLREITDWADMHRTQYEQYFTELRHVKEAVRASVAMEDILRDQQQLIREYQRVWGHLRHSPMFSPRELRDMGRVYAALLAANHQVLRQVEVVASENTTSMGDAGRLALLATAADHLATVHRDLQRFNRQNIGIALQRAKSTREIASLRQLYALPTLTPKP
ncbi:conjugal transfer protein TraI [Rufibacter sp. LB8]|uniref:conjugal transfer protein TraI n=1 Tax=Rufibacter sp. LB8 TaxID=2777781 RepID=UPI00178C2846|nr:conjugal transfer protein TraI [Rufibacter sp. LB8]